MRYRDLNDLVTICIEYQDGGKPSFILCADWSIGSDTLHKVIRASGCPKRINRNSVKNPLTKDQIKANLIKSGIKVETRKRKTGERRTYQDIPEERATVDTNTCRYIDYHGNPSQQWASFMCGRQL